jgi:hypothetical protein
MYIGLHVEQALLLSGFNKLIFFDKFSKNSQIQNFIKILPVGGELLHALGHTDRHDEANSPFSQNCEKILNTTSPPIPTRSIRGDGDKSI